MKTLVAIPVMGQIEIGRISIYQWDRTASPDCHFLLIDNSAEPSPYPNLFERGFLDPKRWNYHRNESNVGLIQSCQQAYTFALGMGADILVLTHNDVWVYPKEHRHWDDAVDGQFSCDPKLGVVGLMGSKGCGQEGHRLDTFGSLIEMAGHGRKIEQWIEPAVCLDGFFLTCSMKMLQAAVYECHECCRPIKTRIVGRLVVLDEKLSLEKCVACQGTGEQHGGFDQRYNMHHVYDYDISLTSIELGYRNAVVNIPCHHLSGLTANNDAYSTSGPEIHHANYLRWIGKWQSKLGLTVDENWNYRWRVGQ